MAESIVVDFLIARFSDLLNTNFLLEAVIRKINEIQGLYAPEIEEHQHRWYPNHTLDLWNSRVNVVREFARKRPDAVRSPIVEYFDLNGMYSLKLGVNNSHAGRILVNSIIIDDDKLTLHTVFRREVR